MRVLELREERARVMILSAVELLIALIVFNLILSAVNIVYYRNAKKIDAVKARMNGATIVEKHGSPIVPVLAVILALIIGGFQYAKMSVKLAETEKLVSTNETQMTQIKERLFDIHEKLARLESEK